MLSRTLADAERYEIDKARREAHMTAWATKEEERLETEKKAQEEATRAAKENSATLAAAGMAPTAATAAGASTMSSASDYGALDEAMGPVGAAANQSLQVWRKFSKSTSSKEMDSDAKPSSTTKFVIKDKPGYELLSNKEVGLCKRLQILPRDYITVKKALIADALQKGIAPHPSSLSASKGEASQKNKTVFKIDIHQHDNIIDFVLEAGWIPTRPNIAD